MPDQRMTWPVVHLIVPEQVLGELLARAQAGVHDLDLACRTSGQPSGDVRDEHLLPHVEHESLAGSPDHGRLEHQLNRLVSGHEVPADLGMRHGDRPARRYLRRHRGKHRAPTAEDVAETDAQVGAGRPAGHVGCESFRHPFRIAKDAHRIGSLVGRYVHERLHTTGGRGLQHVKGSPHVGLECLGRISLQQRQMLERGGMEDDLRPELLEDLPDPACIADVGQRRLVGVQQGPAVQGQLDRVQGGFVAIQHYQLGRPELVQLTAELGADGPAGAGHQDPLAGEAAGDRGDIGDHRPAAEQVSDLRIAHAVNACAAAEQFLDRRDHLRHEPAALGLDGQLADRRAARPGDGDHEHCGARGSRRCCHLVTAAEHRNAPDPQPPHGRVVVEHRHRAVVGAVLAGQPVHELGSRAAGAEDYDLHGR
jgi:hypothetical protein